jgi:hypothetical protein
MEMSWLYCEFSRTNEYKERIEKRMCWSVRCCSANDIFLSFRRTLTESTEIVAVPGALAILSECGLVPTDKIHTFTSTKPARDRICLEA